MYTVIKVCKKTYLLFYTPVTLALQVLSLPATSDRGRPAPAAGSRSHKTRYNRSIYDPPAKSPRGPSPHKKPAGNSARQGPAGSSAGWCVPRVSSPYGDPVSVPWYKVEAAGLPCPTMPGEARRRVCGRLHAPSTCRQVMCCMHGQCKWTGQNVTDTAVPPSAAMLLSAGQSRLQDTAAFIVYTELHCYINKLRIAFM